MSKISAGSTHVQQYAPPFVVSNLVADNWELRWNEKLKAFEAYDPGAASSITFANIGSGTEIVPAPATTDPLEFRTLSAGDRMELTVVSNAIQIQYNLGYVEVNTTSYTIGDDERLIGVTPTTGVTLTLPTASSIPIGDTITIKAQTADTSMTINTAGGNIDGAASQSINSPYGHITVYSDGTNYFIISDKNLV